MMRRREAVEVHEMSPANDGWRVLVYQTPEPLFLPATRTDLVEKLWAAKEEERELAMTWDLESLEILNVE